MGVNVSECKYFGQMDKQIGEYYGSKGKIEWLYKLSRKNHLGPPKWFFYLQRLGWHENCLPFPHNISRYNFFLQCCDIFYRSCDDFYKSREIRLCLRIWVALSVEQYKPFYPHNIGLFRTDRVVLFSDQRTDLIEQFHRWSPLSVFLDFNISPVFG